MVSVVWFAPGVFVVERNLISGIRASTIYFSD